MPFTGSHIAAILPLHGSRLNFTALSIGSMSLDFSYIIAIYGPQFEVHNLTGLFLFGVPVTILTWGFFRYYLEPAWRVVFPWLTRDESKPVIWVIAISALVGAATHLVWDGFTHRYGWPVNSFPIFMTEVSLGSPRPRPLYSLLQHASTLLGGIAVIVFSLATLRKKKVPFVQSWPLFWKAIAAVAVLSLILNIPLYGTEFESFDARAFEVLLVKMVFRTMAAGAIVVGLFPLFVRKR